MEVQGDRLYVSFLDATNAYIYGVHIDNEEVCEWSRHLQLRFPIDLTQEEYHLCTIPIAHTPRAVEVLNAAHQHYIDTSDELDKLIRQSRGELPPDPPTAREIARLRSRTISLSPNITRLPRSR